MTDGASQNMETQSLPETIDFAWVEKNSKSFLHDVRKRDLRLDCRNLKTMDTLAAAFLTRLHLTAVEAGHRMVLSGVTPRIKSALSNVPTSSKPLNEATRESVFQQAGQWALDIFREMRSFFYLLSESLYWSTFGVLKAKTVLKGATFKQMVVLGSSALPIVLLLTFLIGITLAIQSGIQLARFGATIYLASGIGLSMVTEIGPLMTAIILAGRSGSAITAEIATMVVQEEVGALHTMAINRVHFLVLPRFWGMSLTMPLLTVCSAVIGILGGLVVGFFMFDLSPLMFLKELRLVIELDLVVKSLIKSLVFAWLITLIAINKGMNVHGGADAVGRATTSCVVSCIFSIIMTDALFSFIFYT